MGGCALYEGCGASLVGSTLVDSWLPKRRTWPTSTGQFADGCDPVGAVGLVVSLYRPRDNLAMLHGGLAKLMRMSKRNMW